MRNKKFPAFAFPFLLLACFLFPATFAHAKVSGEQDYVDRAEQDARSLLSNARRLSESKDPTLSRRIARLEQKLSSVNIVLTSEGQCKAQASDALVSGFVMVNRETGERGNTIYLCEQARNVSSPSETIIHELTHLSEGTDECNSTFMAMQVALLTNKQPEINGYFASCLEKGFGVNNGDFLVAQENPAYRFATPLNEVSAGTASAITSSQVSTKAGSCAHHDQNDASATALENSTAI